MTKDGRPSRVNDIRYFFGDTRASAPYLEGLEDAVAYGRRLAWFLNGEGFSLGAYPSLYVLFTPLLDEGVVEVTDEGGDWWQRYTNIGVPSDFPGLTNASEIVMDGTVTALKAIRPDLSAMIDRADALVRTHGAALRFPIKLRQTKAFEIEISFSIGTRPEPSFLFVSLTDRKKGTYLEANPVSMQLYFDAFDLAGSIQVDTRHVALTPNESIAAKLTSLRHGRPVAKLLSDFAPAAQPVRSKLVKRR